METYDLYSTLRVGTSLDKTLGYLSSISMGSNERLSFIVIIIIIISISAKTDRLQQSVLTSPTEATPTNGTMPSITTSNGLAVSTTPARNLQTVRSKATSHGDMELNGRWKFEWIGIIWLCWPYNK